MKVVSPLEFATLANSSFIEMDPWKMLFLEKNTGLERAQHI